MGFQIYKFLLYKLLLIITLLVSSCSENSDIGNTSISSFNKAKKTSFKDMPVVLSEVSFLNQSTLDFQENSSDWIEVYNQSDDDVNLKDYYLSDNKNSLKKWKFPSITLKPKEFFTVLATGGNFKNYVKSSDTTEVISENVWSWSDGDLDPPGKSSVAPWEFPGFTSNKNGTIKVSASLYLGDNSDIPNRNWSSNVVNIDFNKDVKDVDFTKFTHLIVEGYIEANKTIDVLFVQNGIDDYLGYSKTLTGTGKYDEKYVISLVGVPILNLDSIKAIQLRSTAGHFYSVNTTISSLKFYTEGKNIHTNFKISQGEVVSLFNETTGDVDSIKITQTHIDGSLSRNLESGKWITTSNSTYNRENSKENDFSFKPEYYPPSGFYDNNVEVEIIAPKSSSIYYTTDGSEPTKNSKKYESKIKIDSTTVIRSEVINSDSHSYITTSTYFINEETTLPIFSISTNPGYFFDSDTGIYVLGNNASSKSPYFGANFWEDIEIPVNIEFFEDDKSAQFNVVAGCKLFGNYSRSNDKKALSIRFSKKFGAPYITQNFYKYKYPHLSYFNSFVLRASGNNFGKSMFRDGLNATIVGKVGVDNQKYRPAILFINGEYWGLYNIREKLNEHYIQTNYNLDKDYVNIIKEGNNVQNGNGKTFLDIYNFMKNNDLSIEENYKKVCSVIDIDSYMDYMICEMYIANQDWPANNYKLWNYDKPNSKWRWIIYDTDFGFGGVTDTKPSENMFDWTTNTTGDVWPNGPESTMMFRKLLENKNFRRRFTNRASVIVSKFYNSRDIVDSIDSFSGKIKKEIIRDFHRWDLKLSDWTNDIEVLKNFAEKRPNYFMKHMQDYFGYKDSYEISFYIDGNGVIKIDGKIIEKTPFSATFFKGNLIEIEAIAKQGNKFVKWSDGSTEKKRMIDLYDLKKIVAFFE